MKGRDLEKILIKYNKIKEIVDNLGDKERKKDERPVISATTALNTITEIWEVLYRFKDRDES